MLFLLLMGNTNYTSRHEKITTITPITPIGPNQTIHTLLSVQNEEQFLLINKFIFQITDNPSTRSLSIQTDPSFDSIPSTSTSRKAGTTSDCEVQTDDVSNNICFCCCCCYCCCCRRQQQFSLSSAKVGIVVKGGLMIFGRYTCGVFPVDSIRRPNRLGFPIISLVDLGSFVFTTKTTAKTTPPPPLLYLKVR